MNINLLFGIIIGAFVSNVIWFSDLVPGKTIIEERVVTNTVTITEEVLAHDVTAGLEMNTCKYYEVFEGHDHVVQICKNEIIRR